MSKHVIRKINKLSAVFAIISMIMIGGGCATKKTVVKADEQPVKEAVSAEAKADKPAAAKGVEVVEPIKAGDKSQPVVVQGMQGDRITISGQSPDAKAETRPLATPGTTTVTEKIAEPSETMVAAAAAPSSASTPTASQTQKPSQAEPSAAEPSAVKPKSAAAVADSVRKTAARTSHAGFSDIYFDYDKYDIRQDERHVFGTIADWLISNPKTRLTIEGHCDERGTNEYNLALGERRASSARKYLTAMGIDKNRTSTVSYGEERPADPGHNEEAWAKNRRAHFIIED